MLAGRTYEASCREVHFNLTGTSIGENRVWMVVYYTQGWSKDHMDHPPRVAQKSYQAAASNVRRLCRTNFYHNLPNS